MTTTYRFQCQFTKNKVGVTPANAPTVKIADRDNNLLVNGSAATSISNLVGVYKYDYTGADNLDLVGIFNTADTTVDQQDVPSYTPYAVHVLVPAIKAKTDNLPSDPADQSQVESAITAATSPLLTSAAYTAPDNAGVSAIKVVTDKLATMIQAVGLNWQFTVEALENAPAGGGGGSPAAIAQAVWEYVRRTLTNPLVTWTNVPVRNTVNANIGETVEISITGIGSLVGRSKLYWTLKRSNGTGDDGALCQIEETDGLIVLNGSTDIPGGVVGSLAVNDEDAGDVTLTLEAELTTLLPALSGAKWDIKYISATRKSVKAQGRMNLAYTTTHAIN